MNEIIKRPLQSIGYNFIQEGFGPENGDEYYLRNIQNKSGLKYRNLTAYEIQVLVRNNNSSDNWNHLQVADQFNPELVRNCKFFGLVRIGKLESLSLEFHNVTLPVGIYNSTIISCDFGDNVAVSHVGYMAHYIIGHEVMLSNLDELHVSDHAKFGNGILKEGETESIRVWVEVCNENTGRKILPFDGMQAGDAWLWARHRDDQPLMEKLKEFTDKKFDRKRGYYGYIGDRTVIKNTSIIKDVWIGSDAYIKGANKLKNLTINSAPGQKSQIGEGCELVNGIIDYGCRIFYGVKAVRFVMASQSQLKYGARLINSYLGNNSTISCCEVLNSLIFPAHEQHHNNSFLCAALVAGQSNIAAGATLGSNHNSRAADGEFMAGRGFWPGLCVSIKHNTRFASFTILAKGDYQYEMDIPLPFSLVSNDGEKNRLLVMPAYWFQYNLYALARNAGKYKDRDKRKEIIQQIEYDYLAPDSINEIFNALEDLQVFTALAKGESKNADRQKLSSIGTEVFRDKTTDWKTIEVRAYGYENNARPVIILKPLAAWNSYREMIFYYGMQTLAQYLSQKGMNEINGLYKLLKCEGRKDWLNVGGQLIPVKDFEGLKGAIKNGEIKDWEGVHNFYRDAALNYSKEKLAHALCSLLEVEGLKPEQFTKEYFLSSLDRMLSIREKMTEAIYKSRAKDYQSTFRKMMYNSDEEMEKVLGRLEDNVFIKEQQKELEETGALVEKFRKEKA